MSKTLLLHLALLLGCLFPAQATDLKISNELLFVEGPRDNRSMYAVLHVEWKNAWKNDQNHDAIWLFCKFVMGEDGYRHIPLRQTGHEVVHVAQAGLQLRLDVAADGTGLFIVPAGAYRGDVSLKIKIAIDPTPFANFNTNRAAFKAFGLEMVQAPTGAFYAGEADSTTDRQFQAFYQPDENGRRRGVVFINSENELTVGKDIAYQPREVAYQGDGKGIIPKEFPKGYEGFYVMKYEIKQGGAALGSRHQHCPADIFCNMAENLLSFQHHVHRQMAGINARQTSTRKELYRRLLSARDFMLDQWHSPLTLAGVAQHACLSPYHFHRCFREAFGEAPMKWFKKIKLEKAKELLANGKTNVSEVALRSGFADTASFSKAFKKEWGRSPSSLQQVT